MSWGSLWSTQAAGDCGWQRGIWRSDSKHLQWAPRAWVVRMLLILSTICQKLQCLSALETQTIRFSCCSFAAFSLMCGLWSLLKKNCFLVVLFIILFLSTILTTEHWSDISNQACQSCDVPQARVSQISWELPTSYEVNFCHLGIHGKYKFELEYPICSNSLILHFTKMDVTITWPMKLQGFYFLREQEKKN